MSDLVETIEYKGCTIEVHIDEDAESPREWDNLGTIIYWHRGCKAGDNVSYDSPKQFMWNLLEDYYDSETVEKWQDEKGEKEFIEYCLEKFNKKHGIILPLYLYEHSGITIRTYPFSCRWDSGQVGWIYITKEKIKKEWNKKKVSKQLLDKVENQLVQEVKTYDQYLTGEVYGDIIKNEGGEEIGSCWGFYGPTKNELIESAKETIDYYLEEEEKKKVYNRYKSFEEWKKDNEFTFAPLYVEFDAIFSNLNDTNGLEAIRLDLVNTIQEMNETANKGIREIEEWQEFFNKVKGEESDRKPNKLEDEHLWYLDELRNSGATNMFEATLYLMQNYPELSKQEARDILQYWMKTFMD